MGTGENHCKSEIGEGQSATDQRSADDAVSGAASGAAG